MRTMDELQPVFATDGQVTAGNASQLSDGGAAVLVASVETAERNGWPVLARIIDQNTDGVEPERVMAAPMPTVNDMLQRNGFSIDDIDIFEHNEAFASASCAVAQELGIPDEKFNPHGGAVAIGHPLGATGARVLASSAIARAVPAAIFALSKLRSSEWA